MSKEQIMRRRYLKIELAPASSIRALEALAREIAVVRTVHERGRPHAYPWDAQSVLACAVRNGLDELAHRYGIDSTATK